MRDSKGDIVPSQGWLVIDDTLYAIIHSIPYSGNPSMVAVVPFKELRGMIEEDYTATSNLVSVVAEANTDYSRLDNFIDVKNTLIVNEKENPEWFI